MFRGDPRGQPLDALGLLPIAAELLVKQQRRQPIEARFERGLAVGLPEERASRSRAVTTRSALRAMVRSLSGSVLITARNAFFSRAVLRLRPGSSADGGSASSSALPPAARGTRGERAGDDRRVFDQVGHFPQQRRFGARPRGSRGPAAAAPWRRARARSCCAARSRSRMTKFSSSRARYSSNDRTLIARPARPLVVRNRWP